MTGQVVHGAFDFPDKGSRVLRAFNEQRRLERALAQRATQARRRDAGFAGASIGRLTASLSQWSGALNADLDNSLVIMRSRARALCANSEWGRRFLSLTSANLIGPVGPALQVRAKTASGQLDKAANDAIEMHFARWARTCDIAQRMTLTRMLQVTAKSVPRDGEALFRRIFDRSLPYGYALQMLEIDRLDESLNQRLSSGNMIRQGVEIDSRSCAVAYYIATAHPGEAFVASNGRRYERVPAKEVFHVFLPERPEQIRGYTWMHAVLIRAAMQQGYEESAIVAARIGASKMGFFKRTSDEAPANGAALQQLADGKDAQGTLQMSAEPGEFMELPDGYELDTFDPTYPHENFEPFLKQCLRGWAMGVDVAAHNLSGDMTGVNYSSARIAEMAERDIWMLLQQWLIDALLVPMFRDWLASALLRGDITFETSGKALPADRLEKFADVARFQGRRWAWVDPRNDAKAARERIDAGLDSRTAIVAGLGREFDDVADELDQERERLPAARASAPAAPTSPPSQE